jgi:hypothetical protein
MSTRSDLAPATDRRGFLKGLLVTGGAAALAGSAADAASVGLEDPTLAEAPRTGPEGYRETEHIRDYYRSARI